MYKRLAAILLAFFVVCCAFGQSQNNLIRTRIGDYFKQYRCEIDLVNLKVDKTEISNSRKLIDIFLNNDFSYQLFRNETVDSIYTGIRRLLPADISDYSLSVYTNGRKIEDLIPNYKRTPIDQNLLWNNTAYTGDPWITNVSKPYTIKKGLYNIHLAITPSHGYYYERKDTASWKWQRPPLFCTREDLLTQSFAYPYLIPMLENAGAIVYSARERDWQTNCVIVDNTSKKSSYQEESDEKDLWQTRSGAGYYEDSSRICREEEKASVRVIYSNEGKSSKNGSCMWIPEIPEDGDYAVYVTYQSYHNSITDARYIVFHAGGTTIFHVNQQMGGGTWVYLGTFRFLHGRGASGMITLDNTSNQTGIICADAVRFGGGLGNEVRGGSISGKARYLEGARYYTKFSGAPDSIYLKYNGADDYREDIQARPRMTNWLSGRSVFNDSMQGARVPLEFSLALHTDAGYRYGDSIIGSLGIYTTKHNDGLLGSGLSRDVSRDLSDMILSGLKTDIEDATGRTWTERGLWDKDYCESREPQIPSMILELLSHQNYYDLKLAYDPNFRFIASRSIYKSILKYVNFMHGRQYVVQPLPVHDFMIKEDAGKGSIRLTWKPKTDPLEPNAIADSYMLYTAIDDEDFDNGKHIIHPYFDFNPIPGHIYRFKVTAINSGGESFPSETLSAYISKTNKKFILIVNGFQRLSGPEAIETDTTLGFDILSDPGVSYIKSPILCGIQQNFNKKDIGLEEELSLGYSGDEYDGKVIAGNTFNYPYIHGKAIASEEVSFVSCSRESLESGEVTLDDYIMIDLIMGLQKRSTSDTILNNNYSTFSDVLQMKLTDYLNLGGRLLTSGAYIGTDMKKTSQDSLFIAKKLKYKSDGTINNSNENNIKGKKINFEIRRAADSENYGLVHTDIISPIGKATSLLMYENSSYSAGVAYMGNDYRCITLGFPFESIVDEHSRNKLMRSFIKYLVE
jgi:hypothetical protein